MCIHATGSLFLLQLFSIIATKPSTKNFFVGTFFLEIVIPPHGLFRAFFANCGVSIIDKRLIKGLLRSDGLVGNYVPPFDLSFIGVTHMLLQKVRRKLSQSVNA